MIQPDLAIFGEKDFQQLMVIRQMVSDLCIPVEVIGAPTFRESDGLAKSSRNSYLNDEERLVANCLYRTMLNVSEAIQGGDSNYPGLQQNALAELEATGFRPDYFTIRRAADLSPPDRIDHKLVILGAAWLGRARLIDNMRVTREILD
jgi:pantoate--beta-alanine ligase